jgi:hypothetical protein
MTAIIHDEIKRRITLGKAAMAKLTKIMEDSGVSTNTKVKLVQTIVFPAVLYGCESWTLMKADKMKLDALSYGRGEDCSEYHGQQEGRMHRRLNKLRPGTL